MGKKTEGVLLVIAAAAVIASFFFPYWLLTVKAPQYPKGLHVRVYLTREAGDIGEIDALNHYIGMRPLTEAARLERRFAGPGIVLIVGCLLAAVFVRGRLSALLLLPAVILPAVFAADLYFWLRKFGLNLDPHAALSSSVKPFIPPLLGKGKIAQFQASANFGIGHGLSMLSFILSTVVLTFRLRKMGAKTLTLILMGVLLIPSRSEARTLTVGPGETASVRQALETASDGDTILVRSGVYREALTVNKSVRLEGIGRPVIDGSQRGTVVTITAPDVVFRGFVVRGSGDLLAAEDSGLTVKAARPLIENNSFEDVLFGVNFSRAAGGQLRGNRFSGKSLDLSRRGDLIRVWYSDDVRIEGNVAERGRDAVLWYSKNLVLRSNRFDRGRYGIHFMYCRSAVVEDNELIGNSVGAYLMYSQDLVLDGNRVTDNRGPSGFGVGLKDMRNASVRGNVIASNRVGIYVDGSDASAFRSNVIAHNDIGLNLMPSAVRNRFEGNDLIDNTEQVLLEGSSAQTVNEWGENYWSDYRGFDMSGDGTGDVPYRSIRLFERLTDRFQSLRIFSGSPSSQAVDFAAGLFPVFAPEAKFEDPHPRMKPLPMPVSGSSSPRSVLWGMVSVLFFLPAAGILGRSFALPARLAGAPKKGSASSGPHKRIIQGERISKRYGKVQALSSVDVEVAAGESLALWGPNGAGKTTLIKCLLGVIRFEGCASIDGYDVKKEGLHARTRIGYVPQEIRLHQDQTVWETLKFFAALRGATLDRAEKLLNEWGLSAARHQMAQNLSGGMKQKLALVIALLSDPPVLLLDEPTSNLDAHARREFGAILERLRAGGKTVIFCTHRAAEVRRNADRVLVLEDGVVKAMGVPEAVRPFLSRRGA